MVEDVTISVAAEGKTQDQVTKPPVASFINLFILVWLGHREPWSEEEKMERGRVSHGMSWTACSLESGPRPSPSPGNTGQTGMTSTSRGGMRPHPRQVFGQGTAGASCTLSLQDGAEMPGIFLGAVMSQARETPGFSYLHETVYGGRSSPGSHQHQVSPGNLLNLSPAVPKSGSFKHHIETPVSSVPQ